MNIIIILCFMCEGFVCSIKWFFFFGGGGYGMHQK